MLLFSHLLSFHFIFFVSLFCVLLLFLHFIFFVLFLFCISFFAFLRSVFIFKPHPFPLFRPAAPFILGYINDNVICSIAHRMQKVNPAFQEFTSCGSITGPVAVSRSCGRISLAATGASPPRREAFSVGREFTATGKCPLLRKEKFALFAFLWYNTCKRLCADGRKTKRKGKNMKVRLKDIAEATGFSVNTVSHALRDMPDISAAAKEKIRTAANAMGYIPNLHASGFKSGRSGTIAVIFPDIINPHFTLLFHQIERFFQDLSVTSLFLNSGESAKEEERLIRVAIGRNADGIILCPTISDRAGLSILRREKVPFVLLGRDGESREDDCVLCDDEEAGYLATRHLLSLGHREIACVRVPEAGSSDLGRYAGYCRALTEAGIPIRHELELALSAQKEGNTEKICAFLNRWPQVRAVFAFSDLLASEFLAAAPQAGRTVPKTLSLVGCDNISASYLLPLPLTSIAPAGTGMAEEAAALLLRRMQGDLSDFPCRKILPVTLGPGKSCTTLRR